MKNFVRRLIKKKRSLLSAENKIFLEQKIFDNFFASVKFSKQNLKIAGYFSINNEVDVKNILSYLAELGHKILLPSTNLTEMEFKEWNFSKLKQNIFYPYLFEPDQDLPAENPDIIMAPMIAADLSGNRIGYGKGFYDKKLKELKKIKNILYIGVGYDFQIIKTIKPEKYDQTLDIIISDKRIIKIKEVGF